MRRNATARARTPDDPVADSLIQQAVSAYETDESIDIPLRDDGHLHLDRGLPFVLLYRTPTWEDTGTRELLSGEASYVCTGPTHDAHTEAVRLVRALADAGSRRFGAFLLIELWSASDDAQPAFIVHAPPSQAPSTTEALAVSLRSIVAPVDFEVRIERGERRGPADAAPLFDVADAWHSGTLLIGIELPPVYRGADGELYPVFHRRFRAQLSRALRRGIHDFTRVQTNAGIDSYLQLAPRHIVQTVWDADAALAEIERSYDLLLLVAPMNANAAWEEFRASRYERAPTFHYRLLPVDPDELKRRLFSIRLDHIPDPAMAFLLRDKREELDRQVSLLADRNSPSFMYDSIRLYQALSPTLLDAAEEILEVLPPSDPDRDVRRVYAVEFAAMAEQEIAQYRNQAPNVAARVQLRPDVSGLMVSRGDLLISENLAIDAARADALLQHEVGTHVLTFYNGNAQPLQQLRYGLADYDELQEGLGVLAEYLVGGITRSRLRTIAARVVAVNSLMGGATFIETFRLLHGTHGMSPYAAYDVTERVHQSGGFTRDMIYLRGLLWVLDYLEQGCDLEALYIGKIAPKHIDIIAELKERGVLRAPLLKPLFLDRPASRQRLAMARRGIRWTELISPITD